MSTRRVLFGVFEADLDAGELRKHGLRLKLQEQPFQVLAALLERPGEIVSRDELRKRLWSEAEFGDFDHGLNVAIGKLREALGDSASKPCYIETVPRRGYRFIAPLTVESAGSPGGAQPDVAPAEPVSVRSVAPVEPGPPATPPSPRVRPAWIVAAAALTLLAAGYFLTRTAAPTPPAVTAVPVTSDPGQEQEPSLSPDGAHVAYVADPDGQMNFDVHVRSIGSGQPRRVTESRGMERNPAWSPDGASIAFLRYEGGEVARLILVPAMGGPERVIAELPMTRGHFGQLRRLMAWFPGGQRLAAVEVRGGRSALTVIDAASGQRSPLRDPPPGRGHADPAPSPRGDSLVFTESAAEGDALLSVDLASRAERVILREPRIVSTPAWTPDGSIVYAAGAIHFRQLYVTGPGGGAARQVPVPGGFHTIWPSVVGMAGGTRLVCHTGHFDVNLWRTPLRAGEAAGPAARVAYSTYIDHYPAYSPDGGRLAFVSNRSGFQEVWVGGPGGENALKLTNLRGREPVRPLWSRDGARIAFTAGGDSFVVDASGGSPALVRAGAGSADWLPDGRDLVLFDRVLGLSRLTPGAAPVALGGLRGAGARVSAGGRWIYYTRGVEGASLYRTPVAGGPESKVADQVVNNGAWTVNGGSVLFIPSTAPGEPRHIVALDPETGVRRVVAPVERLPMWGLDACPDGSCVVHARADRFESDVMLLEGVR